MSSIVGEKAQDFKLQASNGKEVTLADFKGKNVVLYFYPKDMTPGCTTEACDFKENHTSFAELDTIIVGVSPDPVEKHEKFKTKYDLPFILLSDPEHTLSKAYGVWVLKKNFGNEYMGTERSTFVINKEGIVVKEWRKVRVKGHVEDALAFIKNELS
ncbi:thioredoxin-dependent thiol peroxidase [Bacillus sp. FJAT-27986]|jgi:peroxiredoxin Q/BCP|uniref:thioredoxin-dependent thiol peroxidase n=1 Tax=Bacillus sp. FJAT-27986 TaxID=1743146 RepID=UPI00080AFBFA|nr:thioredoxin-dependent thiol peroxidase [Bacillus sp. FJAT-27986]OCA82478.1 peroxiredoxin [Bacillus sp. FJAT-27986]